MLERTKKAEKAAPVKATGEQPVRFKKIGGGPAWIGGHIRKPGEVFSALPSQVPETFRDIIIPVDTLPQDAQPAAKGIESSYKLVEREDEAGVFDVVNEKGKMLNKSGLTEEKAEALIQTLMD